VIAFTFDDGPGALTPGILDVLEGTDDKVTFFINGQWVGGVNGKYAPVIRRADDMGCEIGLHTFSHKNIYFESKKEDAPDELIKEELSKIANLYTGITGKTTYLLRPPGGGFNKTRNYGYTLILWNVDSEDWVDASAYYKNPTAETLEQAAQKTAARVLKDVSPGDIVLMHDIHEPSIRAFEIIYEQLKSEGYRFVTVSELLGIDPEEHTGQYFYSTSRYGEMGKTYTAPEQRSALAVALPRGKEE
jgi:peptidoglycan/xylan/chitin deacetylase (PgdA/CDA1 family)